MLKSSGLSQNKDIRGHSRRTLQKTKLGVLGGAKVSASFALTPLQSNPLRPFSQVSPHAAVFLLQIPDISQRPPPKGGSENPKRGMSDLNAT